MNHVAKILTILFLVVISVRSATANHPEAPQDQPHGPTVSKGDLATAIDRAAEYLIRSCDQSGRFKYRINLDPNIEPAPRYNILRHAGSIYALAAYYRRSPAPAARSTILRATRFLQNQCAAPIPNNQRILAVWSTPELTGSVSTRQAKLGGTGLGLVALLGAESVQPGLTPNEDLKALGRFLIFMQKSDGSYYSKFIPDLGGRDDSWRSSYYPGESALGLMILHELDPSDQWLGAASRAVKRLAEEGRTAKQTFPDQWVLLASQRLLPFCVQSKADVTTAEVLDHARRVCRDMMVNQHHQETDMLLAGCYTEDGRTCPTATRVEGLLAAYQFLPDSDKGLREEIAASVQKAVAFLIRSQIRSGPHIGAIPRAIQGTLWVKSPSTGDFPSDLRAAEVRIDYVQHALSAMLQFESTVAESRPSSPGSDAGKH